MEFRSFTPPYLSQCADYRPLSNISDATLLYYPDDKAYNSFQAVDLLPEVPSRFNPDLVAFGFKIERPADVSRYVGSLEGSSNSHILLRDCSQSTPTGSWASQRVGPFLSRGGYDWWQMSWSILNTKTLLRRAPQGRLGVTAHWSLALNDAGEYLAHPPIHHHHMHLSAAPQSIPRDYSPQRCFLDGICPSLSRFVEHHGDWQHELVDRDILSSMAPLMQEYASSDTNYVKWFEHPLVIGNELNDVRPVDSPVLRWWYEIGLHFVTVAAGSTALSVHKTNNPGHFAPLMKQRYLVFPIDLPTTRESFFWYTGEMPYAGKLVNLVYHAHHGLLQESLFFAAKPEQLGLLDPDLWPESSYRSILTARTFVGNNSNLRRYLVDRVALERLKCPLGPFLCTPFLVATAKKHREKIGDEWFDRMPQMKVEEEWLFDAKERYTVISLQGPSIDSSTIREDPFTQHDIYFITYAPFDHKSQFTGEVDSQKIWMSPMADEDMPLALTTMMLNFGVPQNPPSLASNFALFIMRCLLMLVAHPVVAALFVAAMCFVLYFRKSVSATLPSLFLPKACFACNLQAFKRVFTGAPNGHMALMA